MMFSYFTIFSVIQDVTLYTTSYASQVPVFEQRNQNVSVFEGETATLQCSVQNLGTKALIWRRMSEPNPLTIGGFVYAPDDRISLMTVEEKNEWNLIIKDVQLRDSGVYECAVISREKYRTHVILNVIDDQKSPQSVVLSGKTWVSKGQNIFLTCNATGEDYASDEVEWFINGQKVNSRQIQRVRIFNDNDRRTLYSTLQIRRSTMADNGIYVCRGPNSETASITVHILNEEKSNDMKRGDGDEPSSEGVSGNTAPSCCNVHFYVQLLCTLMSWIIHPWYIS